MLDITLIRTDADKVKRGIARKGLTADIDGVLKLDEKRRALIAERDDLRNRRNTLSKEVGRLKASGADASALMAQSKAIGNRIKALEEEAAALDETQRQALLNIPNLPADDVPDGSTPEQNQVVKTWGEPPPDEAFQRLAHWDIGPALGVLDFDRAAKLSASGFALFVGDGARLVRALITWMLDVQTAENGYKELWPPALVNARTMTGTGQLPKFEVELYRTRDDPLYLIPTAEVPLTNFHQDEILAEKDLPLLYTAYTPCFRREAGAAGRDTRGMIRVHQFDKVELVKFTTPETSAAEHEKLTRHAEVLLERLGLPYRRSLLCAGDMSASAVRCYDLEVYAAGCQRWLEVSSCSNFGDYQARRANIRYRDSKGKVRFVHTLNGSGLALPRIFIALLENFQQPDGSIRLPDVLRPYMGGKEFIGK